MPERPAEVLIATAHSLWPTGSARQVQSRRRDESAAQEFLLVPSADSPRLLVPANNRQAAARSMLRFSAALSIRDIAQRVGAAAGLRACGPAFFSDRVIISSEERSDSLLDYLAEVIGREVIFSLGVGSARANRKPVLQIFDKRGSSLAFAKLGDSDLAAQHVRSEVRALRTIAGRFQPGIAVPELVHEGEWNGCVVLVMTSLRTSLWQNPRRQWQIPRQQMDTFGGSFEETPMRLIDAPMWQRMSASLAYLDASELRDRLCNAMGELLERAGERRLQIGAWHGDWAPWNMARRGHVVQLWDFERFETGVPQGLDRFHYGVNTYGRHCGTAVSDVHAGLRMAGNDLDDSGSMDWLLAGIYLAAISCRYVESTYSALGETIADRAAVMVDALSQWLGRPAQVRKT